MRGKSAEKPPSDNQWLEKPNEAHANAIHKDPGGDLREKRQACDREHYACNTDRHDEALEGGWVSFTEHVHAQIRLEGKKGLGNEWKYIGGIWPRDRRCPKKGDVSIKTTKGISHVPNGKHSNW